MRHRQPHRSHLEEWAALLGADIPEERLENGDGDPTGVETRDERA